MNPRPRSIRSKKAAFTEQFAENRADKTAIIVTHRMGSARIADRIAVMDNGTLVEVGTHDELMESGGLYHKTLHSPIRLV